MKTEMYEDFSDVISRACEEPTLHAAFAWIATWERDVCIENVRANSSWEHDRGSMASIFDMVHASYVHLHAHLDCAEIPMDYNRNVIKP